TLAPWPCRSLPGSSRWRNQVKSLFRGLLWTSSSGLASRPSIVVNKSSTGSPARGDCSQRTDEHNPSNSSAPFGARSGVRHCLHDRDPLDHDASHSDVIRVAKAPRAAVGIDEELV